MLHSKQWKEASSPLIEALHQRAARRHWHLPVWLRLREEAFTVPPEKRCSRVGVGLTNHRVLPGGVEGTGLTFGARD